jgi:Flp pilus assembly pilin Flp
MDGMVRAYVSNKERMQHIVTRGTKGQTMTEYALILAAVAIVAYLTYQVMGQDISALVTSIDSSLNSA